MDSYFASNITYCKSGDTSTNIYNFTSPYTNTTNRTSILATSVAMFTLTALFFNLNFFFGRLSDVSALHNPAVRLARTAALSLSLPVMSYLFSDAMNDSGPVGLSLRGWLILTWMLLVELLRRKTVPIAAESADARASYTGDVEHAARIVWLGNLVFFSLHGVGERAVISVLWVVAASKLVQSVFINKLVKRSFVFGRNAAQVLGQQEEHLPANCQFPVMGEENLMKGTRPHGYRATVNNNAAIVTVGMIWTAGSDLLASNPRLKRLCLSFALFKLLRRRFENPLVITTAETGNFRDLIFNGLRSENSEPEAAAAAVFQTVTDEVRFLSEYYHSILPVVLASPIFFLVNYILFPFMVCCLCFMTIILCGRGDVLDTFHRIKRENYILSFGVGKMAVCLLSKVLRSMPALLSAIDLSIAFLLFVIYIYQEVWEFIVFLLSDWFTVSLLCDYTARPRLRDSPAFGVAIRCVLCARNMLRPHTLQLKQLDVLRTACRLSLTLPAVPVPTEAKRSAVDYIESCGRHGESRAATLSNGRSAVTRQYPHLSWSCESESVADVILTWHIATSLLEVKYPQQKGAPENSGFKAATRLSRYCAYLVAFHPELLPDDRNETEDLYSAMKMELKQALGRWGYYLSPESARYETMVKIGEHETTMAIGEHDRMSQTVVRKGARLGKALVDAAREDGEAALWKVLADLWVELVVCVAAASDEARVWGHKEALAEGGHFVTVLWALATHTGITWPATASTAAGGRRET